MVANQTKQSLRLTWVKTTHCSDERAVALPCLMLNYCSLLLQVHNSVITHGQFGSRSTKRGHLISFVGNVIGLHQKANQFGHPKPALAGLCNTCAACIVSRISLLVSVWCTHCGLLSSVALCAQWLLLYVFIGGQSTSQGLSVFAVFAQWQLVRFRCMKTTENRQS